MPDCRCVIPLFVMFRGSTMGLCRKFVLLSGFPVCFVHGVSSCGSAVNSPRTCTRRTNLFQIGDVSLEWPWIGVILTSCNRVADSRRQTNRQQWNGRMGTEGPSNQFV